MIEEGLRTLLLADSAISALIGTRMHGVILPQKPTMPAIVMTDITAKDEYDTEGATDLSWGRFQFDSWAETLAGARTLGKAVKNKLSGFSGTAGSETISGAFINNKQDLYDPETKNHRMSMDFIIWYKE